jgi:LysR family transcriptional regulator, benzoate and cis,cis-muconate-responsive activator of ben and cat genes
MELRQLRYFTAVASERSFSRAAEKLNVAQPPLSRQVQQLEDELGVRLLDRTRPMTLTPSGRYFFEEAGQLLQRLEEIRAMTRKLGKERHARIGVGFIASTLYDALPELLRRFRVTVPEVEIGLVEMTTAEQIAALREGRIDIAFGRLHFEDDGITRKVIREERLIVVLPRLHPLVSAPGPITLRDIADHPLILDPRMPRPSYADLVLRYFQERALSPRTAYEVRDLQTALGLVAAGAGIAIVPASARRIARDDVVYREIDETGLIAPVIMSHRKGDKSPLLARMKKLIREFDVWVEPAA